MGIVSGIVTFFIIWWIVLFMMLPIGVTVAKKREHPSHASSAPQYFSWKHKALYTTVITLVLFTLFFLFQDQLSNWIFAKGTFFDIDLDFS